MNKKLLIIMATLMVVLPALASCGRTYSGLEAAPGKAIPHGVGVGFANCLGCHAGGMAKAKVPYDHVALNYTNADCSSLGACHARPAGSEIEEPEEPGDPIDPGDVVYLPAIPVKFGIGHKDQADLEANSNCQMCHGKGGGQDYPTPDKNGLWDGGKKGGNSTHHPDVYKVESGSPQDHTGRESQTLTDCTKSGCHSF
ncbi:MAG: hypothetical protein FWH42_04700 [Dehalococcoidia bacterium]|nr:hypothetical protein [Dehalococcoidia bacterium]